MLKNHKSTKGITLIALVITIIVLLILAGVSIAMLTGDNGIITQAKEAKEKTEEAKIKEEQQLETAIIHPAFSLGGGQISGIWVAKFEASGTNK